jgi:hypothetical protein
VSGGLRIRHQLRIFLLIIVRALQRGSGAYWPAGAPTVPAWSSQNNRLCFSPWFLRDLAMMKTRKPSYLFFDEENYPWKPDIDYRLHPELYRVGKGEQGVLICEPYKSELIKHWRFRTPDIAEESSKLIFRLFEKYLKREILSE